MSVKPTLPLLTIGNLTPKWKAIQFAVVNLIHGRRVRRRNRSANGCPPTKGCLPLEFY
ncbi:MAG: hypothetical protein LBK82_07775 [Planctomycetaceae bacterium]|nr:hypothetical protein [Planctomycetaceae bacterium]